MTTTTTTLFSYQVDIGNFYFPQKQSTFMYYIIQNMYTHSKR